MKKFMLIAIPIAAATMLGFAAGGSTTSRAGCPCGDSCSCPCCNGSCECGPNCKCCSDGKCCCADGCSCGCCTGGDCCSDK